MKARARTALLTLGLAVAAAAVLLLVWRGVEVRGERERKRVEAEERIFGFEAGQVKELRVLARGETTRLVREGGSWRIPALDAAAEKYAADGIAERMAGARRKSEVAQAVSDQKALAPFGLAAPHVRVEAVLEDGKVESLALGEKNAFDGSLYVRPTSGAVLLVGGDLEWWLDKSTYDLRDKRLLPFEDEKLARIEVSAAGFSYALDREGGKWRLAAPVAEAGDEAAISRVLSALRGLRADAFLADPGPDEALGFDRPAFQVKLVGSDGSERSLVAGPTPPRKGEDAPGPLRARLAGRREVAALPAGALDGLKADLFQLRDKTVLPFDREKVVAVRAEAGGRIQYAVERGSGTGGSGWTLTAPRSAPAETGKVQSLLYALSTLRAARFADESGKALAAHGLDRPSRAIVLSGEGGKEIGRVEVGKEQGERLFVRSSASPRIVEVEKSALALVPAAAEELEEKPPAKAPAGPEEKPPAK